jgi:hypothetical protein
MQRALDALGAMLCVLGGLRKRHWAPADTVSRLAASVAASLLGGTTLLARPRTRSAHDESGPARNADRTLGRSTTESWRSATSVRCEHPHPARFARTNIQSRVLT